MEGRCVVAAPTSVEVASVGAFIRMSDTRKSSSSEHGRDACTEADPACVADRAPLAIGTSMGTRSYSRRAQWRQRSQERADLDFFIIFFVQTTITARCSTGSGSPSSSLPITHNQIQSLAVVAF